MPGETAEVHARTGIQARTATSSPRARPVRDAARDAALQAVEARIACACYQGGQLQIDVDRSVRAADCACPVATRVRGDLELSLAGLATAQLADKRKVAEQLETTFVPLHAEYERLFRYRQADFQWFIQNVRCVCDGCKTTIFFNKCQLGCAPSIIYKLRARIILAMGFSRDALLEAYRAEVNAVRSEREQVTRSWLLPGLQRQQGWLVPALVLIGAMLLLFAMLRRWVGNGRSRGAAHGVAAGPAAGPAAEARGPLSAEDRARVRRAMAGAEDGW